MMERPENKEKYKAFCKTTYVPIYSKPWWMDAVCGAENWDVWLYEKGGKAYAAMPYYMEHRGKYRYITKPPLTQNNGIVFCEDPNRKIAREAEFQAEVIKNACDYIESMHLDVYEQQFMHTFTNWTPFFWRNYTCFLRYTYVIEDTTNLEKVFDGFSSNYRKNVRKGQRFTHVETDITPEQFYEEHEKVFLKQGRPCPFSREFWLRLYAACIDKNSGQMLCAKDEEGSIRALLYLVWDERTVYHLLGGYIPDYAFLQAYPALTFHGIEIAHNMGRSYDFEGSMIKNIAESFRQFGGTPMPYYRIRKVFNPEIVRKEAEDYIRRIQGEKQ